MNAAIAQAQSLSTGRQVLGAVPSREGWYLVQGLEAHVEDVRAAGRFYIHLVRVIGATPQVALAATREAWGV